VIAIKDIRSTQLVKYIFTLSIAKLKNNKLHPEASQVHFI
jgi:hypothetical protein